MADTVVIAEENENMTLEEEAASKGLDLNGDPIDQPKEEATPEAAEERPEWLPEKFKSVEDMAAAYKELESKQGKTEEAPEAPADEAAAREATEAAGVDYDALSNEFAENGELAQSSYDKLAAAGIPRDLVDQFIAGQNASAEVQQAQIHDQVGGEEKYDAMTEWAADSFSDGEIDAFNDAINSGDANHMRMAVAGLKARFEADQGSEPSRSVSGEASQGGNRYRSVAEMMADMNDARYENDPAFRNDVAMKLSRSDIM